MIILGIHDGHNASAALVVDGKLVSAVGEERFSREKHHYGFPYKAIKSVLNDANISIKDVSRVALDTFSRCGIQHLILGNFVISKESDQ